MWLKVTLFACLLGLAVAEIDFSVALLPNNTCTDDGMYFYFWNGVQQYRNQMWDWESTRIDDGVPDTFDGFFKVEITVDGVYIDQLGNNIGNRINYTCEPGAHDLSGYGYYTSTWDYSVMVHRSFYVPRSTSWARIIDTYYNVNDTEINVSLKYYGNLGSDSSTRSINITQYFSVSTDEYKDEPEDSPFSLNWAGPGAQVFPDVQNNSFVDFEDSGSWYFNFTIPAGEKRSVMHVLGQHGISPQALDLAQRLSLGVPAEVNEMMEADIVANVVNWDLCTVQWKVVSPASTFCSNPADVMLEGTADASITVDGNTYTTAARQVTIPLNGTTTISYTRSAPGCAAKTTDIQITLPAATLAASVDTSGTWPSVNVTGGTEPYTVSWTFPSTDLASAFGAKATVVVMDANKCMTTVDVNVPVPNIAAPSAPTASNAPVKVNSPAKVSSGSQIGATFVGVAALLALF